MNPNALTVDAETFRKNLDQLFNLIDTLIF